MSINYKQGFYFFFVFLLAGLVLRFFVLEPYTIPTPSMKPTILDGDVVLVNKFYYKIFDLKKNDVICFEKPDNVSDGTKETAYFKRCVAVSGDTIEIKSGKVFINSEEYSIDNNDQQATVSERIISPIFLIKPFVIPKKGSSVSLDTAYLQALQELIIADGNSFSFENNIFFINGLPATQYTFKNNFFFALGDNSSESYDSRYFGVVPTSHLVGKVWAIYWSIDSQGNTRFSRIGSSVE